MARTATERFDSCWKSSNPALVRPWRTARSHAGSPTTFSTTGRRASRAPATAGGPSPVAYTTSDRRPRTATQIIASALRTGQGQRRGRRSTPASYDQDGSSVGASSSTEWPRARSSRRRSAAWVAGPPMSGGKIPETSSTLIVGSRDLGPRPGGERDTHMAAERPSGSAAWAKGTSHGIRKRSASHLAP